MKERRRILGITLVQLAKKVNTSTHYIGQIEIGNKFPTPEMLERLATALEIDSPQFFQWIHIRPKLSGSFKKWFWLM
jgi:transcriptional regulator with XRE-family HTH domain